MGACMLSCVQLFVTPWIIAHQSPLFMIFPRRGSWSGLPFSPPGHLLDPGIERTSPVSPALTGSSLPIVSAGVQTRQEYINK